MADDDAGLIQHLTARLTHPQAEILVLLVEEQLLVKPVDGRERVALDQHHGT